MEADLDHDGKISFEEFQKMVENTDVSMSMTLGMLCFETLVVGLENMLIIWQTNFERLIITI
jgi:Ca2+-binding EF-hand superfamily protein